MSDVVPEKRIWLAILQANKEAAMEDAGRLPDGRRAIEYSRKDQLWFAHPGADMEKLKKWLPDQTIRSSGGGDAELELTDALTAAGMVVREKLLLDGQSHRLPVVQGKKGNKDGVYKVSVKNGKAKGWYINYLTSLNDKDITYWHASESPDKADPIARVHIRANARQQRDDAERAQTALYASSTASAKTLYEQLPPADPSHPYLLRKGVSATPEIRQTRNGALVIPFEDVNGEFRTLQYIPPDGAKYLYKNAPKVGNFRTVGGTLENGGPILYAEGYATARSLNMLTGYPVVMTIDAGNMENVAKVLGKRYPDSTHLFMADVDHAKKINKGVLAAERAAKETAGAVILPDLTAAEIERGFTDFNDIHQFRGEESLRATLMPQINQTLERLNPPEKPMSTPDNEKPVSDITMAAAPEIPAAPQTTAAIRKSVRGRPGAAKEKASQVLELHAQGMKPAEIATQLEIGQTSVYRILKAQVPSDSAVPSGPETSPATHSEPDAATLSLPSAVSDTTQPMVETALNPAADSAPVNDVTVPVAPVVETSAQFVTDAQKDISLAEQANQAVALEASGKNIAAIASDMNLGVGETFRILQSDAAGTARESLRVHEEHNAVPTAEPTMVVPEADHAVAASPDDFSKRFGDIAESMRTLIRDADKQNPDELFYDASALMVQWRTLAGVWQLSDEARLGWEHFPGKECEVLEVQLKALTDHLSETTAPEPAEKPAQPAVRETAEDGILTGPRRIAPSDEELPVPEALKHIDLDRLLTRVTSEMAADGKSAIFKLDGEHAFTDLGGRLVMATGASDHEEKVLAALLTAAQYYHGKIELTGSDAFKAFATDIIVKHNLNVTMKVASQQIALEKARQAAGKPPAPVDAVKGNPAPPQYTVPAEPAPGEAVPLNTAAYSDVGWPLPAGPVTDSPQSVDSKPQPVTTSQHVPTTATPAAVKTGIKPEIHTPAEKAQEPVTGKVVASGQAPFRFDDRESMSSYITLHTREGTQTYWGKELEGLINDTRLENGSIVALQWEGKKPVNIQVPVKDDNGVVTGYETQAKHRNQWSLTPVGGERVRTGGDDLIRLTAVDVARYTQIQCMVVNRLDIALPPPPPVPADGLYWIRPDGQGSLSSGDAQTAPRPPFNNDAGIPVMSAWGEDGRPDVYLVKGDGDYLQGLVRQDGVFHHVLVSLPGSAEAPPMVINLLTAEGAVAMGNGNGINRSRGNPVPREHVLIRLADDDRQLVAKLDNPATVSPALHARLGYDERWKPEAAYPKERPAAAPQAAPVAPNRPV